MKEVIRPNTTRATTMPVMMAERPGLVNTMSAAALAASVAPYRRRRKEGEEEVGVH